MAKFDKIAVLIRSALQEWFLYSITKMQKLQRK